MFSKIISGAVYGVDGFEVIIEVDISQGLPSFDIVGLPGSAIKESKERVRSAIKNSGFDFPIRKITINLAPADIRKEGPLYDLPIALGILTGIKIIKEKDLLNTFVCGELSLDGSIRPVDGILPMILKAKENNIKKFIIPYDNLTEASLINNIEIIGIKNIKELINYFQKDNIPFIQNNFNKNIFNESEEIFDLDFSDVKGQESVKRALEISASGNHNLLMIGPPGSGKTMLAKRFPTILPSLSFKESLEVTKIYSISSLLKDKGDLIIKKPFRSPHHTASNTALVGGGRIPKPGEVSLSHNGVLFLDELPEFNKNVLEALRQPLEDKEVRISRANGTMNYPCNFLLLASMNPCPCGYYGNGDRCSCSQNEISKYLKKISGPLLDRIDIQVESSFLNYEEIQNNQNLETSVTIKKRVLNARNIQLKRFEDLNITSNSELTPSLIEIFCKLGDEEKNFLNLVFNQLELSMRAYHKILKVARTIADLNNSENINVIHLSEAASYRTLDRKYWQ